VVVAQAGWIDDYEKCGDSMLGADC
jgi:hypothetical protein